MAQYEFDFESETLDTFPTWLTRRWDTTQSQPLVKSAFSGGFPGLTKALQKTKSANSRALASFNAIDADVDRANAKIRSIIYTGTGASIYTTYTTLWAGVFRASGSAGSETGYAVTITANDSVKKIGVIKYSGGVSLSDSGTTFTWDDNTWYVLEAEISGTTTTTIDISLYSINDLVTPVHTKQHIDSSSAIQSAGWIGIGDFTFGDITQTQHSKIQVATGASSLPPLTIPSTKGITLQLFNGASNVGALTGIQAAFFDQAEPKDFLAPVFKTSTATTDSSGNITLNVDAQTALSIGQDGFLVLYKLDGTDHKLSPALATRATIVDIA